MNKRLTVTAVRGLPLTGGGPSIYVSWFSTENAGHLIGKIKDFLSREHLQIAAVRK